MDCPVCREPLTMSDRQGVEIDYCPRCRGVWLDRGEIDKIVEREIAAYGPLSRRDVPPGMPEPPFYRDDRPQHRDDERRETYRGDRDEQRRDRDDDYRRGEYRDGDYRKKKKKRESFLEDLFDFG
jgi:Zn-finger nucleic acid-binding protein